MTFTEAREKLAVVANGRYRAMYYELFESEKGVLRETCRLYVDSGMTHKATDTWEEAFAELAKVMEPPSPLREVTQAPEGEITKEVK